MTITRIAKGAGNVIHVERATDRSGEIVTNCGRSIGGEWHTVMSDNEYLYGGPCQACLNYSLRRPAVDDADRWIREAAAQAEDEARDLAAFDEARARREGLAESAAPVFAVGDRVGILTGLQAVGGPFIGGHGTVLRTVTFWNNTPEYVVATDDGEELVYRPYLLTGIHCDDCSANVAACVCDRDLTALLTGDPWHVPGTPFPALESEHAEALAMHAEYLTEVEYRARLLAAGRALASAARAEIRQAQGYRIGLALVAGDPAAESHARAWMRRHLRWAAGYRYAAFQRIAYAGRPITL